MKKFEITLSVGNLIFTEDDIISLKSFVDNCFLELNQDDYKKLKRSSKEVIEKTLEKMTNDQLIEFANINDIYRKEIAYRPDSFTQKIYREIFKRKEGMGFKQLGHLSSKQREYLESLGLKSR
ncbi:hypothetical protein [Chryseobacterium sp. 18068]|uniref:hypothetical protein n=1 Tax=Chryseobacterium sp. 18068 TaxID=2681414 RepID=UPI00135A0C7F|nr:hypothetical protein [Chryseobacterium sp. 18068]